MEKNLSQLLSIGKDINLDNFSDNDHYTIIHNIYTRSANNGDLGPYVNLFGLPVHFDPNYNKISVNFSGGADSTILLYILCLIIEKLDVKTKVKPTAITRYYKTNYFNEEAKENCYSYIKQRFPDILLEPIWGFLPPSLEFTPLSSLVLDDDEISMFGNFVDNGANSDVLFFLQFNQWATKKFSIDAIYSGTTSNPVNDSLPEHPQFRNINEYPDRLKHPSDSYKDVEYLNIAPFAHLEKSFTTALYDLLDIADLFNLTQSCEIEKGGCKNISKCFHCAERQWSIDNKYPYLNGDL